MPQGPSPHLPPPMGDTAGTQLDGEERGRCGWPSFTADLCVITACQLLLWLVCVPVTEVISAGGIWRSQLLASCPHGIAVA